MLNDLDQDLIAQLRALVQKMLDDGDCYVESYGEKLADLLRALGLN